MTAELAENVTVIHNRWATVTEFIFNLVQQLS